MLAFVSDLHFRDGTAGEHNLPARAFEGFLADLSTHARNARAQDVTLIFLGDIFDLLRTETWLEVPEEERPWGESSDPDRLEAHANRIMDAILEHPANRETFALLSSRLSERFPRFPAEPKRIYIPGNHDRLCAQFPALLEKARQALGAESDTSLHYYVNSRYGVLARHGHEHDAYNYEGSDSFDDEDYLRVPIGEAVTTELVVRLPYTLMQHPQVQALPPEEQQAIKRGVQEIEHVRPLSAIPKWLFSLIQRQPWLRDVIEEVVDEVIEAFKNLAFVQAWYRQHDSPLDFWDKADKLQTVLFFLEKLRLSHLESAFALADRLKGAFREPLAEAAAEEFRSLDPEFLYIIYGHTHVPLQQPVEVIVGPDGGPRERVYLNTGSWGTRYKEALKQGFAGWRQLTYVILYDADEDVAPGQPPRGFPAFETWSGTLKSRDSKSPDQSTAAEAD